VYFSLKLIQISDVTSYLILRIFPESLLQAYLQLIPAYAKTLTFISALPDYLT